MIMIDVLSMMAKGEIKARTELFLYDNIECIDIYKFDGKAFYNERNEEIGDNFIISGVFLNYIVELIPPMRDCLFEMNGEYELIGVDDNEAD